MAGTPANSGPRMVDRGTDARVTFMYLPPEIRNRVYTLALVHIKPLVISRHQKKTIDKGPRRKKSSRPRIEHILRCSTSTKPPIHKVAAREVIAVGLLKTNKTVNHEASAVLLRENFFIFDRPLALQHFCDTLGAKVKSMAHVKVNEMFQPFANEFICVLSRLEEPKSITVRPSTGLVGRWDIVASPTHTWEHVKPIVWRMEHPLKPGMSFRPVLSMESQQKRLEAFKFDMSANTLFIQANGAVALVEDKAEREARFKALVVECWRREASATGVRRIREEDTSPTNGRGRQKAKRA